MRRWMIVSIVGLFMAVSLCSCSLAVADGGENAGNDRLIGAFITTDYLDLQETENFQNMEDWAQAEDGEVLVGAVSDQQRLYGTIDRSGGEDPSDWKVTFGDVAGLSFFSPVWVNEQGEEQQCSQYDEAVSDVRMDIDLSDEKNEYSMSGTVYTSVDQTEKTAVYYVNPVYQTDDGRIYVTTGTGISMSGVSSEGSCMTKTMSEETKVTDNGKTTIERTTVEVNIKNMYRPVKITLYQMDENHEVIAEETFTPDEFPDYIVPEPKTEYLLVETEKEKPSGETVIMRETCDRGAEEESDLEIFYALGRGGISKHSTQVDWGKAN